ncbi:hypothetical protein [Sporichthya sp.]|uniref:hypothetical protein n=1 Tax=Sporichthya sp. TaxID=65475 RepID=UPI0017956098|nr:hypothetical protein [Sporichthya sp.]MBA3741632.1 hypothetical protein [Sporichthya sp.]
MKPWMAARQQVAAGRAATTTAATGLVLVAVGSIVLGSAPAARADAPYDGLARAVGIDATLTNPSIPAGLIIEGIGPQASAHQSSVGIGDANAAFPYFGDVIPGVPGVLGGIFGLPVPPYPLIASSGKGGPPANTSYPGVQLHAESNAGNTIASAVAGQEASGLTSLARVDRLDDGSVRALADTAGNALKLGGALTLSQYRSHAEAMADAGTGKLVRTASLSIGRISVPGLSFTIPESTPGTVPLPVPIPGVPNVPPATFPPVPLPMAGQTLAEPDIGLVDGYFVLTLPAEGADQKYVLDAPAVLDAFKAAGVTMAFQASQLTESGIVAPAFQFTTTLPSPPPNIYYSGETPVTFSSGLTVAQVDLRLVPSAGALTADGLSSDAPALGLPSTGVDSIGIGGGLPPAAGAVPGLGSVAGNSTPVSSGLIPAGNAVSLDFDAAGIYLALVATGLLAFLAATALRVMGVRFRWGS